MVSTVVEAPPPVLGATGTGRHARSWQGGGLVLLLVLVVVLQRFLVLPGVPVSLTLAMLYVGAAAMLANGRLLFDRFRVELLAVTAILVLAATAGAAATGGSISVTSLGLLLVLWAPWALRVAPGHAHVHRRVGLAFVNLMVVLALVGGAQLALQLAGAWRFEDYLETRVPVLLEDGYNSSDPIFSGSAIWKSNAFVFLEPSSFSQYCALAAIVCLVMRQAPWKILALVMGIGSAVSGTGIVLLVVGAALVIVRAPRLMRPGAVLAAAAGAGALAVSPIFPSLLARAGEPSEAGSSGYLRFVQPFTEVAGGLEADPVRYLVGAGPGAVQRLLESGEGDTVGQAVLYSIIPKVVFEYGVIAGGVFVLFMVLAVVDRSPWPVVPGAVLVFLLFLNGALLQPQTVVLAWLLTSVFTDQPGHGTHAQPSLGGRRPGWPGTREHDADADAGAGAGAGAGSRAAPPQGSLAGPPLGGSGTESTSR